MKVRSEHDPASAFACPTTRYLQSLVRMSEARARGRVERFDRRGTEPFEPFELFEPFEFFQNRNFP